MQVPKILFSAATASHSNYVQAVAFILSIHGLDTRGDRGEGDGVDGKDGREGGANGKGGSDILRNVFGCVLSTGAITSCSFEWTI